MIIEVLDANGAVITKVNGVADPEHETLKYKGASWRAYVPSDAELKSIALRKKMQLLNIEEQKRFEAVFPSAAKHAELIMLLSEFFTVTGTNAAKWNKMKDIGQHKQDKAAFLQQATLQEVEDYNPETDEDWPL